MTREEIRARIRGAVDLAQGFVEEHCPIDDITDNLITELHSQGVVIRVDKELQVLPQRCYSDEENKDRQLELSGHTQMEMLEARFVQVQSLIKEGD